MKKRNKDYIRLQVVSSIVSLVGTVESSINGEKERIKIRNGGYEFDVHK